MKIPSLKINSITAQFRGDTLKARSARSAMILGIGTTFERSLRLVRNMVLARLLAPEEFASMAVVMAIATILEAFVEVGVRQSIIHNKKGDTTGYLNVAWWFQSFRGLIFFALAYTLSPWISSFYHNPELLPLIRVILLAVVFRSLMSPCVYALEKKIQFGKWVCLFQGSGLLGTFATLAFAFFVLPNVWALVVGFVAEAMIMCIMSFIVCPFTPGFSIDRDNLTDMLKYIRKMIGVDLLAVIAFQMDVLVLGRVMPEKQVGMYWLGLQLAMQMNMLYLRVIYPILLPAFAVMRDNKQAICTAVKNVTAYTAIFVIPIVIFLSVCSSSILSMVYGSEYGVVSIPFSLLCFYVMVRIQGSSLTQVYLAIGKPHLHRRFLILRIVILGCLIYPAIVLFGLVGAAASVLLANVLGLCMQVIWMKKAIGLGFMEYMNCLLPGLRTIIIILVPMLLLKPLLSTSMILHIAAGALTCSIACASSFWWEFQKKTN